MSVLFEESLYGQGCDAFVVSSLIYTERRRKLKQRVLCNLMQEEDRWGGKWPVSLEDSHSRVKGLWPSPAKA